MHQENNKDVVEFRGVIDELMPAGMFKIRLDNGHMILGHLSGKMRMNRIRLTQGDHVLVAMTPYDLTKGRIVYRY